MKKILVIDDDQSILELIEILLAENNYQPIITDDGFDGLLIAQNEQVDLIICDLNMPIIDGFKILEKLRLEPKTSTIPFIFFTGNSDKENLRAGMNLGADDYINKPVDAKELIVSINKRLEKSEKIKKTIQEKLDNLSQNIIYSLPHELNTPLSVILGCSELIMGIAKDSDIKKLSEMILSSSKRLDKLFRKFWLHSQIEILKADQQKLNALNEMFIDFPGTIIENVCLQTDPKRQNDFSLNTSNARIQVTEEHFSQIIQEVIDNAIKFSKKGTKIEIYTLVQDNYYVITITDHGKGMTAEQISNIGTYMQFERQSFEQQGMGLGLIIAKKLTELHNGYFEITSIKDKSTTVTIRLK